MMYLTKLNFVQIYLPIIFVDLIHSHYNSLPFSNLNNFDIYWGKSEKITGLILNFRAETGIDFDFGSDIELESCSQRKKDKSQMKCSIDFDIWFVP